MFSSFSSFSSFSRGLELILQCEGEVPARTEGAGGLFHLLGLSFGEGIGTYLLIDHRFAYHILCRKADGQARGLGLGCLCCAMGAAPDLSG